MFRKSINKPLNYPVIFYSAKNTIKKPYEPEPEEKKKKFKFFQKNVK